MKLISYFLACVAGIWKGTEREFEGQEKREGVCEEGGKETPARRPLYFSFLTSTRQMLKSWLVSLQNMSITALIP